ncbi:MAG: pyridoxamine 5'-phosphate oxidase [Oligoflexia bacterium]|nr:pyridoxamine 5'-phosphate oxidase [Oligoflexia bacterium]
MNPILRCKKAFSLALKTLKNSNAIALATATAQGRPSVRMVLLKEITNQTFLFYTNYKSRKAMELKENSYAAFLVYWESLDLQIRVEGRVKKLPREKSIAYFKSRPKGSQIAAHISPQSKKIPSYKNLEKKFEEAKVKFKDKEVNPPLHWGGYELTPNRIEFWTEGKNRLHKRECFVRKKNSWKKEILAP